MSGPGRRRVPAGRPGVGRHRAPRTHGVRASSRRPPAPMGRVRLVNRLGGAVEATRIPVRGGERVGAGQGRLLRRPDFAESSVDAVELLLRATTALRDLRRGGRRRPDPGLRAGAAAVPQLAASRKCSFDTTLCGVCRARNCGLARQLLDIRRTCGTKVTFRQLPRARSIASTAASGSIPQTAPRSCPGVPMSNPLAQQDRSGAPAAGPGSRDPLSIPSEVKASIRVLVVDDERTLRESCASVLQMDGYNVTLVGRGEEALETVKRRKFDIILVDLYMSQISGLEILRAALRGLQGHHRRRDDRQSRASRAASRRSGPAPGTTCPSRSRATHLQVLIGRASHAVMMSREAQDLRVQLHEAARPQRQDRPHRDLAAVPQGGRAGPQGGARPTPRCSSAARAAPARKSSPSSSTRTAGAPAGRWCRSTAPRCPSRCSRPRCSATGRAPSPGPTATSPACSRRPTAARCSSTS